MKPKVAIAIAFVALVQLSSIVHVTSAEDVTDAPAPAAATDAPASATDTRAASIADASASNGAATPARSGASDGDEATAAASGDRSVADDSTFSAPMSASEGDDATTAASDSAADTRAQSDDGNSTSAVGGSPNFAGLYIPVKRSGSAGRRHIHCAQRKRYRNLAAAIGRLIGQYAPEIRRHRDSEEFYEDRHPIWHRRSRPVVIRSGRRRGWGRRMPPSPPPPAYDDYDGGPPPPPPDYGPPADYDFGDRDRSIVIPFAEARAIPDPESKAKLRRKKSMRNRSASLAPGTSPLGKMI